MLARASVRRWRASLVAAAVCGLASLGLAPEAAAQFKPSLKEQIQLGKKVAQNIRKEEKVLPATDDRVQLLREVGAQLLAQIPPEELKKRPFEFSFDLIENKEMNAFALPGGPIFFYTGLFEKFKTVDQLAGVLGHEMIHVREEHWASQYNDNLKRKLGVAAFLTILGANDTVFDVVGIADTFAFELPYSRKHETRSDDGGFKLVVAAGYNPQGMVDVFKMFSEQGGGKPPEFMSTHPDDKKRVKRLEEMVLKSGRQFPAQRPMPAFSAK